MNFLDSLEHGAEWLQPLATMGVFTIVFAFPIGVMFYWLTSNFWTMIQQFIVIRNMPTPGSEAALAREARLAKKRRASMTEDATMLEEIVEEPKKAQRQQPVGKNRSKKQGGRR